MRASGNLNSSGVMVLSSVKCADLNVRIIRNADTDVRDRLPWSYWHQVSATLTYFYSEALPAGDLTGGVLTGRARRFAKDLL